jgi:hypothetical protein
VKSTLVIWIFLLVLSGPVLANTYIGGSFGYSDFNSPETDKYRVNMRGPSYGGFFGVGKDFLGFEALAQGLKSTGKLKHDGSEHDFSSDITAYGAAMRLSLTHLYFRLGLAHYRLRQEINIENAESRRAAEKVYGVVGSGSENGVLYGIGTHVALGKSVRGFVDFTRYQITSVGNVHSLSLGFAVVIPDNFFSFASF